jgi:hypothetical protein
MPKIPRRELLTIPLALIFSAKAETIFPLNKRLSQKGIDLQILEIPDQGLVPAIRCSDIGVTHALVTAFYERTFPNISTSLLLSEVRVVPCVNPDIDCAGDPFIYASSTSLRFVRVEILQLRDKVDFNHITDWKKLNRPVRK